MSTRNQKKSANENNHKVFIARGIKLFLYLRFTYNHVFFWVAIVIACTIIVKACYTKFGHVELIMTTFIQVRKLSLMMTISIHLHVWRGKRWETSFYTWAPLFDALAAKVSWSVSWAIVRSLLHGQRSKWIPKSSMVWSHWHHERCVTIGILKRIWNAIKKWAINGMKGC
jgi:hypothetical protein